MSRSTRGRRGLYLERPIDGATQAVSVLINEARKGALNVQLTVNMPLPHAKPPHDVVILASDLGRDRLTIIEPWVHDPALITWWASHEYNDAWASLADRGMQWFDSFATDEALINYFESTFARHESARDSQPSWFHRIMKRGKSREPATAHYQYLLFLAMLHEVRGNNAVALKHLAAYAEHVKRRGMKSEMSRLERHIRALRS